MGILDTPGLAPSKATALYKRPMRLACLSDSLLGYGEGVPTYVEVMSSQRLRFADPLGAARNVNYYPGQNTAYLLSQIAVVTGATTKPDACLVQGGTNDVIAATSAATIVNNLIAIYDALELAGIRPIICTLPPLGGSFQYSSLRQPARAVNVALRRHALKTGRWLVDPHVALVDPVTASYQSTYDSGDNVHPSAAGIKAWAQEIINKLSPTYQPPLDLLSYVNDGNNATGSRLNTGGGTFGGSAPAGMANVFGATTAQTGFTPSLVADTTITSLNWQRFTVSSATVTQAVYSTPNLPVTGGDVVSVSVRYRSGQDATGSNKIRVYARNYNGATEYGNYELTGPGSGISRTITDGVLHITYVVPTGATGVQLILNIPPSNGTYDFAQPTITNLTTLGVV